VVVAEIGINHSGSRDQAIALIDAAFDAGADAVKFQAGTPRRYVNESRWADPRATPWGTMPYIEYRERMELTDDDFAAIHNHCQYSLSGFPWFVSPLDAHAVERFERYNLPAYKVASPKLTDQLLLQRLKATGRSVLASTGMSDLRQVLQAADILDQDRLVLLHAVSAYPCEDSAVNLRAIDTLNFTFPGVPIGYSGHEKGIWPSLAAVARGVCVLERHFTLDRTAWGSDQAASLEPTGFSMLVHGVRSIEASLQGDGSKALQDIELANHSKFRAA
jgi:N-acetylneuraminate synthase